MASINNSIALFTPPSIYPPPPICSLHPALYTPFYLYDTPNQPSFSDDTLTSIALNPVPAICVLSLAKYWGGKVTPPLVDTIQGVSASIIAGTASFCSKVYNNPFSDWVKNFNFLPVAKATPISPPAHQTCERPSPMNPQCPTYNISFIVDTMTTTRLCTLQGMDILDKHKRILEHYLKFLTLTYADPNAMPMLEQVAALSVFSNKLLGIWLNLDHIIRNLNRNGVEIEVAGNTNKNLLELNKIHKFTLESLKKFHDGLSISANILPSVKQADFKSILKETEENLESIIKNLNKKIEIEKNSNRQNLKELIEKCKISLESIIEVRKNLMVTLSSNRIFSAAEADFTSILDKIERNLESIIDHYDAINPSLAN